MKVLILYRPKSEYARITEDFIEAFQRRINDRDLEIVDMDSREGNDLAGLYDIMQFPAIIVVRSDGTLQKLWLGDELPTVDEVIAYARA
jgi:hypothetical protein